MAQFYSPSMWLFVYTKEGQKLYDLTPSPDPLLYLRDASVALRWDDQRQTSMKRGGHGLWNVQDADLGAPTSADGADASSFWFQVGLSPLSVGESLPTLPLSLIAEGFRKGGKHGALTGADYLVPVERLADPHVLPTADTDDLQLSRNLRRVDKSTRVRLAIESGSSNTPVEDLAVEIIACLEDAGLIDHGIEVAPDPQPLFHPFPDVIWEGPRRSVVMLCVELVRWSLPSLGLATATVAGSLARRGWTPSAVISWRLIDDRP